MLKNQNLESFIVPLASAYLVDQRAKAGQILGICNELGIGFRAKKII